MMHTEQCYQSAAGCVCLPIQTGISAGDPWCEVCKMLGHTKDDHVIKLNLSSKELQVAQVRIQSLEAELRGVQVAYAELQKKYDRIDQELEACFEKNYIDYDYSDGKC